MNPEFRRNLWLEFSTQRLVTMPLVLAAIFAIAYLSDTATVSNRAGPIMWESLQITSLLVFSGLIFFWGGRLAAATVAGEITERTWDGQRMSALSPWAMSWGKLFGSTAYTWYGGAICLIVFVAAALASDDAEGAGRRAVTFIALGVLCHASALLSSLTVARRGATGKRLNVTSYHVAGLAPVLFMYWFLNQDRAMDWYGLSVDRDRMMVLTSLAFAAWAVLGVHRTMRAALQVRTRPWAWISFVAFVIIYSAGFAHDAASAYTRLVVPCLVTLALAYVLLLAEPKDPVTARRMLHDLERDPGRALESAPLWLVTAAVYAAAAVLAIALSEFVPHYTGSDNRVAQGLAAFALLWLRDAAILLLFHLGRAPQRANLAALIVWGVLYGVAPVLLEQFGLKYLVAVFWPKPGAPALWALGPFVAQAALMLAVLVWRWRRYEAGLQKVTG